MNDKAKAGRKISLVLVFVTFVLFFFLFLLQVYPFKAIAQPPNLKPAFSEETLASLGFDIEAIQNVNSLPYDLEISQTASKTAVDSGETVTFNITIRNTGANPVSYVLFHDNHPAQMKNVTYNFGAVEAISNTETPPTWLLPNAIDPNGVVLVSVTGVFTSDFDVTVENIVTVDAWDSTGETDTGDNSSSISIQINGILPDPVTSTTYLPYIARQPTPTPSIILAYSEDFNGSDNHWVEFDTGDCKTENTSNQYWVDVDRTDKECLPPARDENNPERPYRTYGEFEVTAYHSEDRNDSDNDRSDADYGLFINGEGGDTQYIFKISPNDNCSIGGDWELIRNDNGDRTVIIRGDCSSAINQGGNQNTLKIGHETNRRLSLYVNGQFLGEVTESSGNELRGRATGVFVRSDDRDVRIKFDNFRVYKFSN